MSKNIMDDNDKTQKVKYVKISNKLTGIERSVNFSQ